jgi:predicted ATPase
VSLIAGSGTRSDGRRRDLVADHFVDQGLTVAESLLEFLRGKELLVVLDNCEHLLAPVAQLVSRIEQTCPGVQILATSREGLNVAGEWILALGSLPLADPGADLEAVGSCAAVRLFVERARAVRAQSGCGSRRRSPLIGAQTCAVASQTRPRP